MTANPCLLLNFLEAQHSLTSVSFRGYRGVWNKQICKTIATASGNTLTHLDLTDSKIDPDDLPLLLQRLPSLTSLNLSDACYDFSTAFNSIATFATQLRVLETNCTQIAQQSIEHLARACTNLTRLSIGGVQRNIALIFHHLTSLQELDIHVKDSSWRFDSRRVCEHFP